MFEQSLIDEPRHGIRAWAIAASFVSQCLLLTGSALAPLVYTYELPVGAWVQHALLLAPPPPPRPAAPAAIPKPVVPLPARFESTIEAPAAIPDTVALLRDKERSSLAGLQIPGLTGVPGAQAGVEDGVLGVAGGMLARISPPPKPIRVGGNVQRAKIVYQVSPVYPSEAVEQGISGPVHLEAIITAGGLIREVKVLSGDPLLAASALDAVRQWRYRPTYLNGQPVEVITQIDVIFHLRQPPEAPPVTGGGKRTKR